MGDNRGLTTMGAEMIETVRGLGYRIGRPVAAS